MNGKLKVKIVVYSTYIVVAVRCRPTTVCLTLYALKLIIIRKAWSTYPITAHDGDYGRIELFRCCRE